MFLLVLLCCETLLAVYHPFQEHMRCINPAQLLFDVPLQYCFGLILNGKPALIFPSSLIPVSKYFLFFPHPQKKTFNLKEKKIHEESYKCSIIIRLHTEDRLICYGALVKNLYYKNCVICCCFLFLWINGWTKPVHRKTVKVYFALLSVLQWCAYLYFKSKTKKVTNHN